MSSRRPDGTGRTVSHNIITRRQLLAVGGVVAVGGFAGCLNRVASSVTNTGASPAAAFAGERSEQLSVSEPNVRRLTPTVSGGSRGVGGEIELEGWVTSSAVVAANYNNTRSNRSTIASPENAVTDEELEKILAYLAGEAVVGERFAVCLPDAEVPGGNGSIADAVTPQRLVDYMAGRSDGDARVYSWGDAASASDESGDCDDSGGTGGPGATCGATEHLAAAVSGPMATGGGLVSVRDDGGTVTVLNTPPSAEGGASILVCPVDGEAAAVDSLSEVRWDAASPELAESCVAQVMVRPPGCPHPFPAVLYVGRGLSDDQFVYAGGWVIDDAALFEDSVTVLTMADSAQILGVDLGDLDADGDGLGDAIERSLSGERARRGARIDAGPVDALVEMGVISEAGAESVDHFVRKRPGRTEQNDEAGGESLVTHVALDAPVLHLVNAADASNEVKFKAGAELSKGVN